MREAKAPPADRAALIRLMAEDLSGRGKFFDQAATNTQIVFLEKATSVLTVLEAAGCRVVPVKATEGIVLASTRPLMPLSLFQQAWNAVLSASPYAPEPRDG